MKTTALVLLMIASFIVRDQPLTPSWSPDHKVVATTKVPQAFATPEGANYSLLLNGKLIYPVKLKHSWFSADELWHTFLSELAWSPDSRAVALVEKVYNWQYSDPYNRDFDGTLSNAHLYLAIVPLEGQATGYELDHMSQHIQLSWPQTQRIILNEQQFDLATNPPKLIR